MSFWGAKVAAGAEAKFGTSRDDAVLHLSQACMDPSASSGSTARVVVEKSGSAFVVACLREGKQESCALDLFIDTASDKLKITGDGVVHLTGYYEDLDMGSEEELDTPAKIATTSQKNPADGPPESEAKTVNQKGEAGVSALEKQAAETQKSKAAAAEEAAAPKTVEAEDEDDEEDEEEEMEDEEEEEEAADKAAEAPKAVAESKASFPEKSKVDKEATLPADQEDDEDEEEEEEEAEESEEEAVAEAKEVPSVSKKAESNNTAADDDDDDDDEMDDDDEDGEEESDEEPPQKRAKMEDGGKGDKGGKGGKGKFGGDKGKGKGKKGKGKGKHGKGKKGKGKF